MKILDFFYFCGSLWPSWIRIRIRNLNADQDPDPATQINADPCCVAQKAASAAQYGQNTISGYCPFKIRKTYHVTHISRCSLSKCNVASTKGTFKVLHFIWKKKILVWKVRGCSTFVTNSQWNILFNSICQKKINNFMLQNKTNYKYGQYGNRVITKQSMVSFYCKTFTKLLSYAPRIATEIEQ